MRCFYIALQIILLTIGIICWNLGWNFHLKNNSSKLFIFLKTSPLVEASVFRYQQLVRINLNPWYSQKKKKKISRWIISEKRGGEGLGPPLLINRSRNVSFKKNRTRKSQCINLLKRSIQHQITYTTYITIQTVNLSWFIIIREIFFSSLYIQKQY